MSTPTPTTRLSNNPPQGASKKWLMPLLLGLVGILSISNVFLLVKYSGKTQNLDASTEQLKKMERDSVLLRTEYTEAMDSLEKKKSQNKELNTAIEDMQKDLTIIYQQIGLKVKSGGVTDKALISELSRMKSQMQKNLTDIEALKKDNKALTVRVATIQTEKDKVTTERDQVTTEKLAVVTQRDSIDKANKENLDKIEASNKAKAAADATVAALNAEINNASFVLVPTATLTAMNQRRKSADETSRARKADYYRICIKTAVNPLVKKGNQKFFIRLINASGEPVQIGDKETTADGKPVRFVLPIDMEYEGTAKDACADWQPTTKLKSGEYSLDVFNNNKLVGQTKFKLK